MGSNSFPALSAAKSGESAVKDRLKAAARLLRMVSPLKGAMTAAVLFGVLGHLCAVGFMGVGAMLLAPVFSLSKGMSIARGVGILAGLAVLRGVFRYLEQYKGHDVAFRLLAILRNKLFDALRRLAPGKPANRHSGDLATLAAADVEIIEVFFAHTVSPVLIALVFTLCILAFTSFYGWVFPVVAGVFYLVSVVPGLWLSLSDKKHSAADYRKELARGTSHFIDSVRGIKEILLFGRQEARLKEINEVSRDLSRSQWEIKFRRSLAALFPEMMITLATGSMLLISAFMGLPGEQVLLLTAVVASSFGPVSALSGLAVELEPTFASAARLFAILDEVPEVKDEGKAVLKEDEARGGLDQTVLDFKDVGFKYPNADKWAVRHFNLKVRKGEKVAVVGPSGSGKSTLLRLLLRFYETTEGSIEVKGIPHKDIALQSLRRSSVLFTQETFLFSGTISENIALGKPGATRQEIRQAARRAGIQDFIESLPKGYDEEVGELGDSLSGGERQRLGLARVLLSSAPILILDEPSSNLDSLNEKAFLATLEREFKDKTVLVVSHRPSVVAWADRICTLGVED